MDTHDREMQALGQRARAAARQVAKASGAVKTAALQAMASALRASTAELLAANAEDLASADARGVTGALRDRLKLTEERIEKMARGLDEIALLPDPVGQSLGTTIRPNGLRVGQVRIPLGVIGIVYEARPNVTADAAGLCLKAGNVVILRGGSEAAHSNTAILKVLRAAAESAGLPADAFMTLPSTDRAWVMAMLKAEEWLDLVIPRGGEALIRFVAEHARVPVIKHYKGVCHVYVDAAADLNQALDICYNAKVQRPGVCNAAETFLIHRDIAAEFLPKLSERLSSAGVEVRGCDVTRGHLTDVKAATADDYHAEFLDLIVAMRVVSSMDEAIEHIETYGSDHTEAIVSEDYTAVQRFLNEVNSSVVVANASTRFADGGELGLGAEIGISTTRLHAYGPMGVTDLTARKWVVYGSGQTRS
ncbi:MAG: glutamate-5-semialdehyde dehydrogenase [Bradymonadia bacterium]